MPRPRRRVLVLVALALVAGACGATTGAEDLPPATAPEGTEGVRVSPDLIYERRGDLRLQLDLYRPAAGGPFPVVVWVHGGAWVGGNRRALITEPAADLLNAGWAIASISYELAGSAPHPRQVQDVKTAVRWIKANGAEWELDPTRVALMGFSAGAHLVAIAGATVGDGTFAPPDLPARLRFVDDQVGAVVAWFGPSDLATWQPEQYLVDAVTQLLGCSPRFRGSGTACAPDVVAGASPITWFDPDDPPLLVAHGSDDDVVEVGQGDLLVSRARDAGVDVEYDRVEGGGHGNEAFRERYDRELLLDFLARTVSGPAGP